MDRQDAETLRRAYARQVLAYNGIADNPELLRAFSRVPREKFLGPSPWRLPGFGARASGVTPEELDLVYRDVLFVLDADKGINNGEPSLHALLIDALAPVPGARVVHIGAGTGYYTAILAELIGPTGRVIAVEADGRLGEMARQNLAGYDTVEVIVGDGTDYPKEPADCVYVSFAVAAPAANWIDNLAPGGRLILPLGVPGASRDGPRYTRVGAMLMVTRMGAAFAARFICPAAFIFGTEGVDEIGAELEEGLERAFASRRMSDVKSLVWREKADPACCWFHAGDWGLSYDPPGSA